MAKTKEQDMVILFYIGDSFYRNSGSVMSSIYVRDTLERYDWGKVGIALRNGKKIVIEPATDAEKLWAYERLETLTSK